MRGHQGGSGLALAAWEVRRSFGERTPTIGSKREGIRGTYGFLTLTRCSTNSSERRRSCGMADRNSGGGARVAACGKARARRRLRHNWMEAANTGLGFYDARRRGVHGMTRRRCNGGLPRRRWSPVRTGLEKVALIDGEKGRQRRVVVAYKGTFQRALHVEEDHEDPKIRR